MDAHDASVYWLTTRRSCINEGVIEPPYEIDERCVWSNWGTGDLYPMTPDGTHYLDPGWDICWGQYDMGTSIDTTLFNYTIEAEDMLYTVNQNIRDLVNTYWVNLVTADSAEACKATLEEARSALQQAGIEQMQDFRSETYKANLAKIGA